MKKILEFLKNYSNDESFSQERIEYQKLSKSFNKFNQTVNFNLEGVNKGKVFSLPNRPNINKGQIWLCKQRYFDAYGNEMVGEIPYMVCIVSSMSDFGNKPFVRVQPISPFLEFLSEDEVLVEDNSITGFEFVIQTWNEQPVLTELLDEFVGVLTKEIEGNNQDLEEISESIKKFRKTEIRNTAYLRQSLISLIDFQENENKESVFLNIDNSVVIPINRGYEEKENVENYYLEVAKKGLPTDRREYLFKEIIDNVEIEIKVIRSKKESVITVNSHNEIILKNKSGEIIEESGPGFYDNLTKGLFLIELIRIEKEIRIILE